jgi:hypothetical protein
MGQGSCEWRSAELAFSPKCGLAGDPSLRLKNGSAQDDRACLFLSVEIDEQIWGFVDADSMQLRLLQLGFEALPDCYGQVFGSRNLGEEFGDLFVEEAMVHGVEDFAVHDFFKLLEVDDESGARVDFAFYGDFEGVVVPVSVGVVAFAEKAEVLFRSEIGIVIVVRGGEFGFSGQVNHESVVSGRWPVISTILEEVRANWVRGCSWINRT